jgi:hypothetical protein
VGIILAWHAPKNESGLPSYSGAGSRTPGSSLQGQYPNKIVVADVRRAPHLTYLTSFEAREVAVFQHGRKKKTPKGQTHLVQGVKPRSSASSEFKMYHKVLICTVHHIRAITIHMELGKCVARKWAKNMETY